MILPSLEQLRVLPRLAEITRTFLHFGLQDLVHSVGLHRILDQTSGILGWRADPALLERPLPERFRLALEALGPAFVKLGQVLASRVDLLSPEWIRELGNLHDSVGAVPFAELEAQLVADLGRPVDEAFAAFEREPRAAASIAQVHRAVLADGQAVAVKIRRPGVEAAVEADLVLLEALAAWWEEDRSEDVRVRPIEIARQLRRSIAREVDFAAEARGQQRFSDAFRERPEILIPRVHPEFTRVSLLVMDWVDGIPGTDLEAADRAGLDRRVLAARGADAVLKMVIVDGLFHADPHPGNVFYLPGNRIAFIDFGMVGWLSGKRRDELVDLLAGLAGRDAEAIRDVLLAWTEGGRVNSARFAEDIARLVYLYDKAALQDVRLGTLLGEIAGVMREHHLMLPPDLALLFKAITTLEGLGLELDPEFRLVEHVTPYIRDILRRRWEPRAIGTRLYRQMRELSAALGDLPRAIERMARQVGDDGVGLNLEIRQLGELTSHLERSVNRLAIGMVTAALIVGSSILLAVSGGPASLLLQLLGAAGIAIAFVNSVWLVVTILRSGRR